MALGDWRNWKYVRSCAPDGKYSDCAVYRCIGCGELRHTHEKPQHRKPCRCGLMLPVWKERDKDVN